MSLIQPGAFRAREPRIRATALMHGAAMALLLITGYTTRLASAAPLCESCELQIGIGETYHFWGATGGLVIPITLNWSDNRYEIGLFRVSRRQILYDAHYPSWSADGRPVLGTVPITPLEAIHARSGHGILWIRDRGEN
jgi:hypothetical protein